MQSGHYQVNIESIYQVNLRLDIGGYYPQNVLSFEILQINDKSKWFHCFARIQPLGTDEWGGDVLHKQVNGIEMFEFDHIEIKLLNQKTIRLMCHHKDHFQSSFNLTFQSSYFRSIELEYAAVSGINPLMQINTVDYNDGLANFPHEILTVEKIFKRVGFDITISRGDSVTCENDRVSDTELYTMMKRHWSKYSVEPRWAAYLLFAKTYSEPTRGGVMIVSPETNQRQGAAVFNVFPDDRFKFFTVIHELGHVFNLYHSWSKVLDTPWLPLSNEEEARSFMNNPSLVWGGEKAFWRDFQYRFSDNEILFMRHAPESYVKMGGSAYGTDHALTLESLSL